MEMFARIKEEKGKLCQSLNYQQKSFITFATAARLFG
jgi:hypothetical protein